jgi:short-subunit dehydrogenase
MKKERLTVVITGASSGIGEAAAYKLSSNYDLILVGRKQEGLEKVLKQCNAEGNSSHESLMGDINDEKFIDTIKSLCLERKGKLKALINSAGVGYFGDYQTFDMDKFDQIIGTNLRSVFLLTQLLLPMMSADVSSRIINISSDADTLGFSQAHAYCASKGALLMLSKALQEELQPKGIRVNVVSPGRVDTCFNGKKPGMRPGALMAEDVAEVVEFLVNCSPNIEIKHVVVESMTRNM